MFVLVESINHKCKLNFCLFSKYKWRTVPNFMVDILNQILEQVPDRAYLLPVHQIEMIEILLDSHGIHAFNRIKQPYRNEKLRISKVYLKSAIFFLNLQKAITSLSISEWTISV